MATKRSRAAFEADLQRQQSPYVFFGTALPPLDAHVRDDGSYVPVWKQDVVDERGRKRLHGAFTGGFSDGYFNTVGSKEGWTPATFVSSRSKRHQPEQRAEDYMDDEDLADADEARQLETKAAFSGLGSTEEELRARGGGPVNLIRPAGETMGMKLLRRMGWRDGQGIGPQVRRKTKTHEPDDPGGGGAKKGDDDDDGTYLAPPENTKLISLIRKTDSKGLGYEGEQGLSPSSSHVQRPEAETRSEVRKPIVKPRRGGIGIGVLNDTGSDEEDPYDMGPKLSSYGRTLGGDKKKKKKKQQQNGAAASASGSNPLLTNGPVFVSKKMAGFRKCHDGRLPLDGFVLSTTGPTSEDRKFPAPTIPEGWVSSLVQETGDQSDAAAAYQSTADMARASILDPSARASMLGETLLPSKSVFDFLTPSARDKLAVASNNTNLPPARSEAPPLLSTKPNDASPAAVEALLKSLLDPQVAAGALIRSNTASFVPYADDPQRLAQYRAFLAYCASLDKPSPPSSSAPMPACPPGTKPTDFVNELHEFAQAAAIFKPATGALASRFAPSGTAGGGGSGESAQDAEAKLLSERGASLLSTAAAPVPLKPDEQAARSGMWGPLTRTVEPWYPSRLLCKRFGVAPPAHVMPDGADGVGAGGQSSSTATTAGLGSRFASGGVQAGSDGSDGRDPAAGSRLEIVGRRDMDELRRSAGLPELGQVVRPRAAQPGDDGIDSRKHEAAAAAAVDPTRNAALEAERPSDETFRAIFADDDDNGDGGR